MTVPLPITPGRSGFHPELSLSYDSGSGNGAFGFGWTLSLPAITRKTDKGLPRYDDANESDVYILSGSEDLVPFMRDDGTRFEDGDSHPAFLIHRYRPRIEGLFARIERWTEKSSGSIHWRSISRDNVTSLYGLTGNSRIADPADPARVFSWLLCDTRDDKGNVALYSYDEENADAVDVFRANERNHTRGANRYLKRVLYGNRVSPLVPPHAASDWMFELVFDYDDGHLEEIALDPNHPAAEQLERVRASSTASLPRGVRPDPFSSHRSGFEVRTYRRCHRVLMFHRFPELGAEPCLVRATEFDYRDIDEDQSPTVEDEIAHDGSTRAGSFLMSFRQSGFVREHDTTYIRKSLPPVHLEYSRATIDDTVRELEDNSLANLPMGIDGTAYQWVDLDGEGVSGILSEQAGSWFYKPNLGDGKFGAQEPVALKPSLADLVGGRQHLLDLAGDGQLDLVTFSRPNAGFYERSEDANWEPFQPFRSLPNVRWEDPNLRFVDLNGDGHADLLLTENEVFTWYESLGEDGFASAREVRRAFDEEFGPALVLADGTQSIYLADVCGHGLSDLVRIRNGEVCYWPNQGYGRFGAKVSMDNAPWFDDDDQFEQRRIRLADIDGSGTNDILYLHRDGVRLYFNQAGNRWSDARRIDHFPRADQLSSVMTADLLGNGTACLVWSTALPGDARAPLRYIDLMGGQKPHLLIATRNNLGAETRVHYVSSTSFYLADKAAGKPWVTRLPMPVHVVDRVEISDRISRNFFVSRFAYHHGHYDGVEREFRGFGMVEQWDTEEFGELNEAHGLGEATNIDAASHVPPMLTCTWFHTGAYMGREHVSDYFAGLLDENDRGEYYREPGLTDVQARARLLDDTVIPAGLTTEEEREACRALRGSMLRREIYALDRSNRQDQPYSVTEQNFTIELVQREGTNRHAVFLTHVRESLAWHYERDPSDPRVVHTLTIEVDPFGNVLRSANVAYGRRNPDGQLEPRDQAKQALRLVTFTENDVTNAIDEPDVYRAPQRCQSRNYELTGYAATGSDGRYSLSDFDTPPLRDLSFEEDLLGGRERRLIECLRVHYRADDLDHALLPLREMQSLALPGEEYRLVFTPGLLATVFSRPRDGQANEMLLPDPAAVLAGSDGAHGGYVDLDNDGHWWIPSGRVFYSPETNDAPAQELDHALRHFFLPHRYRDAFLQETSITYDGHALMVVETRDALGNRITAGERALDPTQPLVSVSNDYRVLQPALAMDANRNQNAVAFDALGMVVATAVMGKPEDNPRRGDRLDGIDADLTNAIVAQHLQHPLVDPAAILGHATTRLLYDLFAYQRTENDAAPQAPVVYTLTRETHDADLAQGAATSVQHGFSYSDGFAREIQKKTSAEPAADGAAQWIGSGWTIFNNKGKPVRQFEPFFTPTHDFEFDARVGFSPTFFYDPALRTIGTLHADHSWEKIVFSAWHQETWDVNDTLHVDDPRDDADLGDYFRRLPDDDFLPTWRGAREAGALGAEEQQAAAKALIHARTYTTAHLDPLARTILSVAQNREKRSDTPEAAPPFEERVASRVTLDIKGKQRELIDARDQTVMRYDYDLTDNRIRQVSMDGGARWILNDAAGKPLRAWDTRGHDFRSEYDQLRRPLRELVRGTSAHSDPRTFNRDILFGTIEYGEGAPNALALNLRGRIFRQRDGAGIATNDEYDFKGNLLRSSREIAVEFQDAIDWAAAQPPGEHFSTSITYDALNRIIEQTTPHSAAVLANVVRFAYNRATLLQRVEANLRGNAAPTPFVTGITYDAKRQRTGIHYATRDGAGITTTYTYDARTFRLADVVTARNAATFDATDRPGDLQRIHYTYDPAGNVTHIRDDAQQTVFFNNRRVEPSAAFTYDALYRLIEATGREHLGQNAPVRPDGFNSFHTRLDHPGDGDAMGTYIERYVYDVTANILSMQHRGTDPAKPGWKSCYQYSDTSNRLLSTGAPADPDDACGPFYAPNPLLAEPYEHDVHGNMTRMPHLRQMRWDFHDQLLATSQQVVGGGATPETTWYTCDSAGQRVRKVTQRAAAAGAAPALLKARIYLGPFEIYREYDNGVDVSLQRDTLHVMDDKKRVALVETRTDAGGALPFIRYQLGNHLGSVNLELDDDAAIISYEEYTPFGSSSYQAVRNQLETPKRYRYTGKERDEETGLAYHGARYYAPWIGRWTACDPSGVVDGLNLYTYVRCNPISRNDSTGRQCDPENATCLIPSDPRSYDTIEQWRENAPSPLSEQGIIDAWNEAHPVPAAGQSAVTSPRRRPAAANEFTSEDPATAWPQTAGSGAVTWWDAAQRSGYLDLIHNRSDTAVAAIRDAEAAGDLAAAEQIAREASLFRNTTRTATQELLSPGGRYMSQLLESDRSWPAMFERYGGTDTFETYSRIAAASGRSAPAVTWAARVGRYAGPAGVALGVGVAGYEVATAPEGQRTRVAVRETGGIAGGGVGATAGTAGGSALAGGIAVMLGIEAGPPGWLVLGLGALGGLGGGVVGSEAGRAGAGAAYDSADQQLREFNATIVNGIYNLYGVPY